jgi:Rrf2 family protein
MMFFSKSFGYAVRGVLYIAEMQHAKRYVQAEEIAIKLSVPRHFMSKILKKLAKEGVIASVKGRMGGFTVNEHTLDFPLIDLFEKTDGLRPLETCALRFQECDAQDPCPLHHQMEEIRGRLKALLNNTTVNDFLKREKSVSIETN